ncbi:hypothetical protein [Nocardia jiangxiensis]|uniref:hypothetical protein n=1 Tax=Nocardia jiangxiensis TaxID=282685 RepID=UPI0002F3834C|nr:hypothetical protein [Nocardia jiangxiensis]
MTGPGHEFGPPPGHRPRASGMNTIGLIVAGAAGLVVVLGVGVAIGLSTGSDHDSGTSAAHPASARTSTSSSSPTPTTHYEPAPGIYSMNNVTNACDLVDTAPLTKWSSGPTPIVHREYPAQSADYGGVLLCQIKYTSTSPVDNVTTDDAEISLQVQFTGVAGPPKYDEWKSTDTVPQQGASSGDLTGLGTRSYWYAGHLTAADANSDSYAVGVQDSNVSLKVEVGIRRARGEAEASRDDLATIATSQARTTLDKLRKP